MIFFAKTVVKSSEIYYNKLCIEAVSMGQDFNKKQEVAEMSGKVIDGIALNKLVLSPQNLAFTEKLERFRCAVVLDEPGCDRRSKAQLGIYDVLKTTEAPNILIVTTEKLMYSWYQTIIGNLGADFKFITGAKNGIFFIDPALSNLLIVDAKALKARSEAVKSIENSGLVWDLLIIDGGLSHSGFEPEFYIENLHVKAKKLAVFAAVPPRSKDGALALAKLPEAFLSDFSRSFVIDENVLTFGTDTPVMKYERDSDEKPRFNIKSVSYPVPEAICKAYDEQNKRVGGTPGGNIFEELAVDKREIYVSPQYDKDMVAALVEADPKLAAYLDCIDEILSDPENTAVTYFRDDRTLEYIQKVLSVRLPDYENSVTVRVSGIYDIRSTRRRFGMSDEGSLPRLVLAKDGISERILWVGKVTHVLNYELPDSPDILQHRYKRFGGDSFASPEFIVFADEARRFDGRMLERTLALNFLDSYRPNIPSNSVYTCFDGLEKSLAGVITELKALSTMPQEKRKDDFATAFSAKYCLPFTSFQPLLALAGEKLGALCKAFGVTDETGAEQLEDKIKAKLDEIRGSYAYIDENGVLTAAKTAFCNDSYRKLSEKAGENRLVQEKNDAAELLKQRAQSFEKGPLPYITDLVQQVKKPLRNAVLFNVYRYLRENFGTQESYREFMRKFNEGAI